MSSTDITTLLLEYNDVIRVPYNNPKVSQDTLFDTFIRIPTTGHSFLMPVSFFGYVLKDGLIMPPSDNLVLPLFWNKTTLTYASPASMFALLVKRAIEVGMIKLVIKSKKAENPTCVYYGTTGFVCDCNMVPLWTTAWECASLGNGYYRVEKLAVYIDPALLTTITDPMASFLTNKGMKVFAGEEVWEPYHHFKVPVEIRIAHIPFYKYKVRQPRYMLDQTELRNMVINNIDNVVI